MKLNNVLDILHVRDLTIDLIVLRPDGMFHTFRNLCNGMTYKSKEQLSDFFDYDVISIDVFNVTTRIVLVGYLQEGNTAVEEPVNEEQEEWEECTDKKEE